MHLSFKLFKKKKEELQAKNAIILAFIFTYAVHFTVDLHYFIWLWVIKSFPFILAWKTPISISYRGCLWATNSFSFCLRMSWFCFILKAFFLGIKFWVDIWSSNFTLNIKSKEIESRNLSRCLYRAEETNWGHLQNII